MMECASIIHSFILSFYVNINININVNTRRGKIEMNGGREGRERKKRRSLRKKGMKYFCSRRNGF